MNLEVKELIKVIHQTYGRDISMYDRSFIEKSLKIRWIATGIKTVSAYLEYLSQNYTEADAFFRSLNITYSEFFRNLLAFVLLEQWILPKLIEKKSGGGEIRVWSAGCAAGQEAYSITLLLNEFDALRTNKIRYRIFATDISESVLTSARQGVYDAATVQNVRLKHIKEYFIKQGETYSISSVLKERVNFSAYDLLDKFSDYPQGSIYGDFDLVFCSNLLFYYRPEIQQFILHKMGRSMSENGYLVTGEAERTLVGEKCGMRAVAPPASIFQKKRNRGVL